MSSNIRRKAARPNLPANQSIVWGARNIGAVIGRNERQASYLLETGRLPARKIGALWVAKIERLLAAIEHIDNRVVTHGAQE